MEQICQKLLKPAITKALTSRDSYIKINHVEISEIKKNFSIQTEKISKLQNDLVETRKTASSQKSAAPAGYFDRKYG